MNVGLLGKLVVFSREEGKRERERKNRNSNTTSSSPPQRRRQPQTRMHVLSDYFHAATAAAADSVCRLVLSGCVCFAARQIVKHSVRLLLLLLAKWSTQTGRQTHTSPQRSRKADSVQKARKGREQVCASLPPPPLLLSNHFGIQIVPPPPLCRRTEKGRRRRRRRRRTE